MPRRVVLFVVVALCCLTGARARGHAIWLDLKSTAAEPQARIFFGEEPAPGAPHLLAKVAHTRLDARDGQGATHALKLKAPAEGVLAADCSVRGPFVLEAFCDYGYYPRGGFLLQYYAKHLSADWAACAQQLARSEQLALDLVPRITGDQLSVQLLFRGKPAADSEIVIIDPAGEHHQIRGDGEGRVSLTAKEAGRYAIQGTYIEPTPDGQRDGKKFAKTWHTCTLTLDHAVVDASPSAKAESRASDPDAVAALKRARDGRSIWRAFPGFSAELTISGGGQTIGAKATIDANGVVTLDMPESKLSDWVEEQLNSLVQHRMPDGEVTTGRIAWAEPDDTHPLGRKIDLGDPTLQSAYRLKDDVIMEVNRLMGAQRFTISVLEIERNAENKYLPRSFTMNFFDAKSGELKLSLGYLNRWQPLGHLDVPQVIVEVSAQQGAATTRRIEFANCRLLQAEGSAEKPTEKSAAK